MAPHNNKSSEGQKGKRNAPVTREGVGAASDSLESSAFKSNNEEQFSSSRPSEGSHRNSKMAPQAAHNKGRNAGRQGTQAGNRDSSGPHGKNLKEDDNLSGENASFTEFGTKADPGRMAEKKFTARDGMTGGMGREKRIDGKTPFDGLGSERPA